MQILMSDSLLNRVNPEEPASEKLLANFVLEIPDLGAPVTRVEWQDGQLTQLGLGIADMKLLSVLLKYEQQIDLGIPALDLYVQNIFSGSYKLLEHNNYSYELLLELEREDG